jgi:hypothetical protein
MWLMQIAVDQIQPGTAGKVRHMSDIVGGKVTLLWLKSFDADALDGRGSITMTDLREDAMRFDSLAAVFECWKTQSNVVPLRDDGRPNRPLTAYSIQPVEWRP